MNATATHCTHSNCTPRGVPADGGTDAGTINHVHTRGACFADLRDHTVWLMKGTRLAFPVIEVAPIKVEAWNGIFAYDSGCERGGAPAVKKVRAQGSWQQATWGTTIWHTIAAIRP